MQLRDETFQQGRILLINVRGEFEGGDLETGRPDEKYSGLLQAAKVGLEYAGRPKTIKMTRMKLSSGV